MDRLEVNMPFWKRKKKQPKSKIKFRINAGAIVDVIVSRHNSVIKVQVLHGISGRIINEYSF